MTTAFYMADDGCRLAYALTQQPGKPVLLLSPSLGTSMALFEPQLAALGQHFTLLRHDPRGHGASDAPVGGYSLDRLGRDVVGLLDHLGLERVHFAGVSLGGMTGQWLGYRTPERIGRLVLANTTAFSGPPSNWTGRIATVLRDGMAGLTETILTRWFTPPFLAAGPPAVAAIRALLNATSPQGYAGCCAAIRDMDLRATAPLIGAPTLVIAGLQDPSTTPEAAQALTQAIPGAQMTSLDSAHLGNVELADAFNAVLLDFLRRD